MIPKKPVPDLIRDGNRFSDKIMLKQTSLHQAAEVAFRAVATPASKFGALSAGS